MNQQTNFGYRLVSSDQKTRLVQGVFSSVASRYDLMNDLMSLGQHRLWKWFTVQMAGVSEGQQILDLACGSGDLLLAIAKHMNKQGRLVGVDPSPAMLDQAKARTADSAYYGYVELVQACAEELPFEEDSFDLITCSFGFRNTTDKNKALQSCLRVLKPGGRLMILEFSHPQSQLLGKAYDLYSKVLPGLGQLVADDSESYRYLVESIRVHPDQESLKNMMQLQGFCEVGYTNLHGGIVALHSGYKPSTQMQTP